jgi:hypothetical protein
LTTLCWRSSNVSVLVRGIEEFSPGSVQRALSYPGGSLRVSMGEIPDRGGGAKSIKSRGTVMVAYVSADSIFGGEEWPVEKSPKG